MKSSTLLAVAASLLSLAGAWEITWNDANGNNHTKSGHGPSDCIAIDNPKGHLFKIDSQGEQGINMLLFTNSACSGDSAGMATDVFSKEASKDLLGFKVESLSSTASGNSTTTAGNSTATGHSATTATTTKTEASSHSASTTGSTSASKTTETTVVTSAAATTSSSTSGSASSASSSAAPASTSNAAVRMAGSNADIVKGVMCGIVGLAAWMI
ncbi:uncharacterized protein N7458_012616 [Penicillium daleae]|uniref:Uncharacterized protein n=1 Tax=Penicillium daleae TaxID=63821 RepID=A0AAD6BVN0_9EURO|nr:uncharacterized protein N7458_012616 [Penicillium daleae]KAJ5433460.1 hypothetical protein N7458_012616 [Penicillium daleae]